MGHAEASKKPMNSHEWPEGSTSHKYLWHFQKRLFERYQIVLEPREEQFLYKQIKEGIAKIVNSSYPSKPGRVVYCVSLFRNGEFIDFDISYNLGNKSMVTVLPKDNFARRNAKAFENKVHREIHYGRPKRRPVFY